MLPDGFQWARRWEYDPGDNAIFFAGVSVAYMDTKVDGSWFARLDTQGQLARCRDCTSREAGRAGCEAWVTRHADRLRVEALARANAAAALQWQGKSAG